MKLKTVIQESQYYLVTNHPKTYSPKYLYAQPRKPNRVETQLGRNYGAHNSQRIFNLKLLKNFC